MAAHKDDPSHPAHKVAEKIRERFVEAETLAERGTSMFVGVNPDAGRESKQGKMRHHAEITGHKITAGTNVFSAREYVWFNAPKHDALRRH